MGAWYVVQVKRHNERRVEKYLGVQEVPALLPIIEVVRRWRDRKVRFLEPLFPGYLFVHAGQPVRAPILWQTLRWTPGVRRILGADGHPLPVPDEVIETIRARTQELGFIRPGLPFAPGSRLRITHGPLGGLEVVFDRVLSGSGRVRVLLELLGQQRGAELDGCDLEAV